MCALVGDDGMARDRAPSKCHRVFKQPHGSINSFWWGMSNEWVGACCLLCGKAARGCFSKGPHARRHYATWLCEEPQVVRCKKDLAGNGAKLTGEGYRIWAFLQLSGQLLFQIRTPGRQLADSRTRGHEPSVSSVSPICKTYNHCFSKSLHGQDELHREHYVASNFHLLYWFKSENIHLFLWDTGAQGFFLLLKIKFLRKIQNFGFTASYHIKFGLWVSQAKPGGTDLWWVTMSCMGFFKTKQKNECVHFFPHHFPTCFPKRKIHDDFTFLLFKEMTSK